MNKGWLELESDPGLFTLLVEDFGVQSVQVEEIYDLQKTIDGPVYGFIFLFRWIEERRSRRKTVTEEESFLQDENVVNSIFFAQQVIPNSCATHALLSVLLNNDRVKLGSTLSKLKDFSKNMSPEDKGFAIGNMPELASAHNRHARPEPRHLPEKQQGISTTKTMEAFHFVSYVPIGGHLFELDGLKPHPIDHGPWRKDEYWTEKFRRVITERLGMATGGEPYHDIRFNLMAVVPDKRQLYEQKLTTLKTNRQIVLETLQQCNVTETDSGMVKVTTPGLSAAEKEKYMVAVKKHGQLPDVIVTRETTSTTFTIDTNSATKTTVVKACPKQESNVGDNVEDTSASERVTTTDIEGGKCDTPAATDSEPSRDVTTPLTIETQLSGSSPGPSSESTDTASEAGSCFSSPNSTLSSCNSPRLAGETSPGGTKREGESSHGRHKHRFSSNQAFTPKDLLALLKNVENEIALCETNLKDEIEKKRKYQIDDCRRTHNYDQFICTFLSMLAKEGHLADLVQQQVLANKRHGSVSSGRITKVSLNDRRKRARPKKRR
ncbi:ubiquitin carboxyl-terminal hydrolase BAP1-like isoform X2 [Mizuhopecten yessoensis]|uniref:ubiquitin carboxyl-terminal hydrolase BAP1-like isoform X2 n=1 Tax=Mizuhopecten yessoensis TaxID=6573 RepID=UPI000B45C3FC|nr:ubiquitin carboxyl-terminal hydrolase BAP1-like isoform X2 [Mizuhopecten yessoensis]